MQWPVHVRGWKHTDCAVGDCHEILRYVTYMPLVLQNAKIKKQNGECPHCHQCYIVGEMTQQQKDTSVQCDVISFITYLSVI